MFENEQTETTAKWQNRAVISRVCDLSGLESVRPDPTPASGIAGGQETQPIRARTNC
jgi:hypothetical protein